MALITSGPVRSIIGAGPTAVLAGEGEAGGGVDDGRPLGCNLRPSTVRAAASAADGTVRRAAGKAAGLCSSPPNQSKATGSRRQGQCDRVKAQDFRTGLIGLCGWCIIILILIILIILILIIIIILIILILILILILLLLLILILLLIHTLMWVRTSRWRSTGRQRRRGTVRGRWLRGTGAPPRP